MSTLKRISDWLPCGGVLSDESWESRHRAILYIIALHIPVVVTYALARGFSIMHAITEATFIVTFAIPAALLTSRRRLRAAFATTALLMASAVLVHISGGLIEMHFHFFVVIALLSLYQDWQAFLLAIGYTLLEHGVIGVLAPKAVYAHHAGQVHPWAWAAIHAGFVLAASAVNVVAWRFNENAMLTLNKTLEQLEVSERQYREVVGTVRDVVFQVDNRTHWTFISTVFETLTGRSVESVDGQSFLEIVHVEDRERVWEALQKTGDADFRIIDRKGFCIPVAGRWQSFCDERNEFAGASGTIRQLGPAEPIKSTAEQRFGLQTEDHPQPTKAAQSNQNEI